MKKTLILIAILLIVMAFISACTSNSRNYATGQAYQYVPPPQAAGQNFPSQPGVQGAPAGVGCGI